MLFRSDFVDGLRWIRQNPFLRCFITVTPIVNAFFGATFSVCVAYLLRQTYAVDTWVYSLYNSVTAGVGLFVPLFAVPLVKKYPANKLFFAATLSIAACILLIGICALCGIYRLLPVMVSVALITALDCMTIAAAIPMQMTSSIMLQTRVEKGVLGRVSATIRLLSIASIAVGEMAFGLLNDATWVWLPIFVGAAGVATGSLLFRRTMATMDVDVAQEK